MIGSLNDLVFSELKNDEIWLANRTKFLTELKESILYAIKEVGTHRDKANSLGYDVNNKDESSFYTWKLKELNVQLEYLEDKQKETTVYLNNFLLEEIPGGLQSEFVDNSSLDPDTGNGGFGSFPEILWVLPIVVLQILAIYLWYKNHRVIVTSVILKMKLFINSFF